MKRLQRIVSVLIVVALATSGCAAARTQPAPAPPGADQLAGVHGEGVDQGDALAEIASAALLVAVVATGVVLGARSGGVSAPPLQLDTVIGPCAGDRGDAHCADPTSTCAAGSAHDPPCDG